MKKKLKILFTITEDEDCELSKDLNRVTGFKKTATIIDEVKNLEEKLRLSQQIPKKKLKSLKNK